MKSLLERIDDRLSGLSDPVARAELLAERASYMVRIGEVAGATAIVQDLRARFGDGRSPRVSIRLILAEGITAYYQQAVTDAAGRLVRAFGLSRALGHADLLALCAAWLAHVERARRNYGEAVSLLNQVAATAGDSHALNRAGVATADTYMQSGQRQEAQAWYQFARHHALAVGDRASIAALMHNRSVMGLAWYRAQSALVGDVVGAEDLQFLRMAAESSDTYHRATRILSRMHLSELGKSCAFMLTGDYAAALPLLQRLHARLDRLPSRNDREAVKSDLCLCLVRLQQADAARALFDTSLEDDYSELDADDQLVILSTYKQVCDAVGRPALGQALDVRLDRARQAYHAHVAAMREALRGLRSPLPPSDPAVPTARF